MKYLPLLLMGCVKTQIVYVERIVEVRSINDVALGVELMGWCEELKQKGLEEKEMFSEGFFQERESLNFEVQKCFPWGSYPYDLENCLVELEQY